MKKRILAMLLSVVMLASTVELTSLLTGTNILAGTEAPAVTDTAPTSDTETASGGQRITDKDTAAIRLSGSELSVSGDIEPDAAQPSSGGTATLDENNALTIPYDLAFPEEFASDDCLYAGDQIMVKFARGFRGKLNTTLVRAGITGLEKLMDTSTGVWYIASVTGDVQQVMANVRALDNVVLAEYDYMYAAADTTLIDSDTVAETVQGNASCRDQWYLRSGNLQKSWDLLRTRGIAAGGDSSVVVAVIDTGVDYTHEDLKDNIWVNTKEIPGNGIDDDGNGYIDDVYGVDLETGRDSGMDDNGHGTHVAGIIAASNNHIGVVGLAYNVKLMPIKAGMASGFFNQSQIAKGILYAYNNGADVINMSFGGSASTIAVQDALETAYTRCVLVAAAGNDGAPNEGLLARPTYPAALSYVMGVMSVDMRGVESGFTNYDVKKYNSVEYEVYAPGSQILSTIPGNRYATWSGTSMAAPYVSAMAALLRSAYPDTNTYPTKFIYGQIAATGGRSAICCDPKAHGAHNLPKIVDIYNALTQLPKPEVSAADFLVFDDKSLSDQNNGDGVIDAGETVALAFTLRNRWGTAKDVTLSLDARSQADIDCPYIEFLTNNVNYGNVGTYASIDYGKTKEGTFVTGVDADKSLLVKIADDCPNDYIIALNITVTAKNDLDADDTKVYSSEAKTTINVRRGTLLPSIITEDMTLTKDHYYILPNATLIQEGVTVTVEPGTQLQFWTDDPHDAYADTAITYLKVDGTLLCQGTEDEHIRMFPSELMSQYRVQLYEGSKGTIKLYYTDVVNPYLYDGNYGITYAENCEFSQNYRAVSLYYRYLGGGTVNGGTISGCIRADILKDCALYKLGGDQSFYMFRVNSPCDGCIFVDSSFKLNDNYEYTDCVFYGNSNYLGENSGYVSSYTTAGVYSNSISSIAISDRDKDTGTVYAAISTGSYLQIKESVMERFAEYIGGEYLPRFTAEYNAATKYFPTWSGPYYIIAFPDTTITDITLPESEITLDTGMTKQLLPEVAPVKTALVADLKYTSLDERVVTVSDTGLITPVAAGGTLVRVSNADGSVYKDVAVHVADCVPLESLTLNEDALRLEQTNITDGVLTDSDLVLDYSESLLKGDNFGTIALKDGSGEMVSLRRTLHLDKLTLTPVSGFTDGMSYTLTLPAGALQTKFGATSEAVELTFTYQAPAPVEEDSLTLGKTVLTGVLSPESGTKVDLGEIKEAFKLEFKCVSNPDASITWTVADNAVAMVENGNLIALSTGCTTVTAALDGTDLAATALLYISEDDSVTATKSVQNGAESTVLFSNGTLFALHADGTTQQLFTDAVDFHWDGGALWVKTADALYRDGELTEDLPISVKYTNLLSRTSDTVLVGSQTLILTADKTLCQGENFSNIAISGGSASAATSGNQLLITPSAPLISGTSYTVTIPANSVSTYFGAPNEEITFTFIYLDTLAADAGDGKTVLASGAVSDNEAAAARAWTSERLTAGWKAFCDKGYDTLFYGNAILNRFTENNVEKWLRITAPSASSYVRYGIGGNYWGTEGLSEKTKKEAINKQILDFDDYQSMADLNEGTILETIPETVWPVVRSVSLRDANGEAITTVGAGKTTFTVTFNRDMDTEMPLQVRFGSSYPYADFEVAGQWLDSRTWEGSTTMASLIANGIQYWSIANGRSAEGHLKLYKDWGRFSFNIDTSSALAMTMQAEAADDGVILTWAQDDFDTLAGYNVYRCDREDGQYAKLNTSVIPADVKTFTDTNVTPGQMYYYNFTVVKTDLSESKPSGKISVRAKDTMAPNIYHDGVYSAFTGGKLIISATANDNLQIDKVELFYRVTGTESWRAVTMTAVNDRYSAVIPSSEVTTAGLEYYIRAFDGVNYAYKGTAEQPYAIAVSEAVDRSALGDVNGDGQINVLDALMVLQASNDRLNLDAEQFARADLNGNKTLEAVEVLTILQYANGIIGSLTL